MFSSPPVLVVLSTLHSLLMQKAKSTTSRLPPKSYRKKNGRSIATRCQRQVSLRLEERFMRCQAISTYAGQVTNLQFHPCRI